MLNLTNGIWTNSGFDVLVLEEVVKMVDDVVAVKVDKLVVVAVVVTLLVLVVEVMILMSGRDGFSDVVVSGVVEFGMVIVVELWLSSKKCSPSSL